MRQQREVSDIFSTDTISGEREQTGAVFQKEQAGFSSQRP
jgi:hypothetical protein